MFLLFKKREISDYISDTFNFFKFFGKHFFKNYFIINSGFLLLLGAVLYWLLLIDFNVIYDANLWDSHLEYMISCFSNSTVFFWSCVGIGSLLFLLLSLFNLSYPVLYFKLVSENNGSHITLNDLFSSFQQNFLKILKFSMGFIFILCPIIMLLALVLFILCLIIIGFPLFVITVPTLFTFISLSFYAYLLEEKGFFESLKQAYDLLIEDFWSVLCTTFIMMVIAHIVQGFVTMGFYFSAVIIFVTAAIGDSIFHAKSFQFSSTMIFFMTAAFMILITLGTIFSNIIMISQGIIYSSLGEKSEKIPVQTELIENSNE